MPSRSPVALHPIAALVALHPIAALVPLLALQSLLPARAAGQRLADVPLAALEPVARIPGHGPGYALDDVREAILRATGELLVRDGLRVLEFDGEGRLKRQLGGEGSGPGEFKRIRGMGLLGDTLWVADVRHRRVTWLRDGRVVRNDAIARDGSRLVDVPTAILRDGTFVTTLPAEDELLILVRKRRTGGMVEALGSVRSEARERRIDARRGSFRLFDPFAATLLRAPAAGGRGVALVERPRPRTADPATYRVLIHVDGATHARVIRYDPGPVPAAELALREEVLEAYTGFLGRTQGLSAAQVRELFDRHAPVPEFGLPVLDALMDAGGWSWLQVGGSERGAEWIALDRMGGERVRVRVPPGETLLCVAGRRLVTALERSGQRPSLVVYEVELSRVEQP